jgi:hypothetical protein
VSESKTTAFENFRKAAKKIVAVPREEILKREAKYQAERKIKNQKRDR